MGANYMNFLDFVDHTMNRNLTIANEEAMLEDDPPDDSIVWGRATECTAEELLSMIHQHLDQRWWAKQEGVNRTFYS